MTFQTRASSQSQASVWFRMWRRSETWLALLFILPSLVGFVVFFAVPAVRGLVISFTDWDLLRPPNDVGTENYVAIIQDPAFWHSLAVTVQYVLLNIPLQTVIAVGLAALMARLAKSTVVRGVLVLPWLIPNVVVALLWLWLFNPQIGLINQIIGALGIDRQGFLGSPDQAMASVAIINVWRHAGYTALLIFAGLQSIPGDVYEAGAIDGASENRMFWSITLPLLRPVLVFVMITTVIGSFQIFDTIAITTKGGPVDATRVLFWYIYEFAFTRFKMGYAAATAIVLFVILLIITLIQMRYFRGNTSDLA